MQEEHSEGFHAALGHLFNVRAGRASFQTIRKRIVSGARIDGTHLVILVVAMLIACVGLNIDSTEAIVGSMLICPLMGSVMAIAYAVATADGRLLREAVFGLVVQIVFCLVTSTIYFTVSPLSNKTSELLGNSSPTIWVVIIAAAGGFAGALGTSRNQEPPTLLAGVAVATALMPPLCASGYGIATHDLSQFATAFYTFLLNVVFIALAADLMFIILKAPLKRDLNEDGVVTREEDEEARAFSHRLRTRVIVGTVIVLIPCLFVTYQVVQATIQRNDGSVFDRADTYEVEATTRELQAVCPGFVSYHIGEEDAYDVQDNALSSKVRAELVTSEELGREDRERMRDLIRLHASEVDEVTFRVRGDKGAQAKAEEEG